VRRRPHLPSTSLPQLIALVYLFGSGLGTGLLHLPGVTVPGAALGSIDPGPVTFAVAFSLRRQRSQGVRSPPERDILVE
jgi:hypothetical protein